MDGRKGKILVVRLDRLGDVLLSTPVIGALHQHDPDVEVTFLVQANLPAILTGIVGLSEIWVWKPAKLLDLVRELKQRNFSTVIFLQSHFKLALAAVLARIPIRIGPVAKIYSYLFYNHGLRQRRSRVEKHEADYNLELLTPLGIHIGSHEIPTAVEIAPRILAEAKEWLIQHGYREEEPLICIHPGMGGSALNWPQESYFALMTQLLEQGHQICVTGGPAEELLLDSFEKKLASQKKTAIFYRSESSRGIDFLAGIFMQAQVVVAPSTGPLHLAVALRKKVVTFYPPIRVQSKERWGPYYKQADQSKAHVFQPNVECQQDFHCIGSRCHYYPCMKGLTVKEAIRQIKEP